MYGVNKEKIKIEADKLCFGKGELHETSTEHGLTAIVMEAENLEQAIVMPIIQGEL